VALTPHPLLVPWSRKSRATPLLLLWAAWPVQSLSVCTRVHFTFLPCYMILTVTMIHLLFYQHVHCISLAWFTYTTNTTFIANYEAPQCVTASYLLAQHDVLARWFSTSPVCATTYTHLQEISNKVVGSFWVRAWHLIQRTFLTSNKQGINLSNVVLLPVTQTTCMIRITDM